MYSNSVVTAIVAYVIMMKLKTYMVHTWIIILNWNIRYIIVSWNVLKLQTCYILVNTWNIQIVKIDTWNINEI